MKIDDFGQCIYSTDDLVSILYKDTNVNIGNFTVVDPTQYNKAVKSLHLDFPVLKEYVSKKTSLETFDKNNQEQWFYPSEYDNIELESFLKNKCSKDTEWERVQSELKLYKKFNLEKLLRYLIYLVDTLRENNLVWGVGRGSSVASYVLYLIGVHKINSLKYNLDINEFLR